MWLSGAAAARAGQDRLPGTELLRHAKEGGRDKPEYPWFFSSAARARLWATASRDLRTCARATSSDYEAELVVVAGQRVPRHVSQSDALQYVFGYSRFNDMSVRTRSARRSGPSARTSMPRAASAPCW
ncbi:MAG: fumarylacetoacetate hydrolase family protein [Rubrivivax sp.]